MRPLCSILLSTIVAGILGCDPQGASRDEPKARRPRILLIAADGLEWSVALSLIRQRQMPELERLMQHGAYGLLRTLKLTRSPRIWATVATGKRPQRHGILGFVRPRREPGPKRLYRNTDRKTKAFWNILSDYGLRVHVVGWWTTFPVEKINGVMIARTNTRKRRQAKRENSIGKGTLVSAVDHWVYPPERQGEMLGFLLKSDAALPNLLKETFGEQKEEGSAQARRLFEESKWVFRADVTHGAIARKLAAEQPSYDLMAAYFQGADIVGHRFWRYFEPEPFVQKPSMADVRNYGNVIPAYYAFIDRMIGRLRRASPSEPTIFVISDHGMGPKNKKWRFPEHASTRMLNSGHHRRAPDGLFVAAGVGIRAQGSSTALRQLDKSDLPVIGSVLDIVPTVLALLGIPVGEDMDGTVLTELLAREVLKDDPVASVPTHDTDEWLASRHESEHDFVDDFEDLEQLRALGYID